MEASLDPLLLGRLQFAFTIGFHILFPTMTIGLAGFLVFLESRWLLTKHEASLKLYKLWSKIFALTFGMGVVSGIVMTYQLGTNFGTFSRITGPVLGPLLSIEVLTAFFVEAGFIGVMLFGWNKVKPVWHWAATVMVFLGTLNSAFWILVANSWMHTPAGAELVDGVFHVTDWGAVILNPSMPYRVAHMLVASFLTVSFVVAGVGAFYLLRDRGSVLGRQALSLGLWAALILAPTQIVLGDLHGLNTKQHQPVKVAAMEGLWEGRTEAPLVLFGLPDQEAQTNHLEVAVPGLASLILTHEWDGYVAGLDSVAPERQPPVAIVFWSFRVMVGIGLVMLSLALIGLVLRLRRRLTDSRWFLRAMTAAAPIGFIATLAGWITTEVGRQPYTVYGLITTAESVSPITGWEVAISLALFIGVYGVLGAVYLHFVRKIVLGRVPGSGIEIPAPARPTPVGRGADRARPLPAE